MGDSPASSSPTALLAALQKEWPKDKRSVKDCLRSKALPCPEVKNVIKNGIKRQEIKMSYYSILSTYLGQLKDCAKKTLPAEQKEESALWHMSRIATVVRFLQLLFEYKLSPEEDENAAPSENGSAAVSSCAGDPEINKMILQLLQSLAGVVCTILEADTPTGNNADDVYSSDASQSFDAQKVACFVFGSLVRINHYVRIRPSLLSPLWKCLCDMASAMNQLPAGLLNEAVKALVNYLREGTEPMLQICASATADYQPNNNNSSIAAVDTNQQLFQVKVLGFLIARVTTLLKLPTGSETASCTATTRVFAVLALLRGLGAAVHASVLLQHDLGQLPDDTVAFFKPYAQIATKVERSVCSLVWNRPGADVETLFNTCTIHMMCRVQPSIPWSEDKVASVSDAAIALGKALLLLRVLQDALEKESIWSQPDVEAVLRVCEDVLLHTLPCCHGSLIGGSAVAIDIIARAMRVVSAALLRCEVAAPCIATNVDSGRHRFHRLLVKWLSSCASFEHPLARELVTTVVYLHTVGLCESSSDSSGVLDAEPLLILLVKLFFEPRTSSSLRLTLANVVQRVLASSTRCVGKRLGELLKEEFATTGKILSAATSKKRKRTKKGLDTKNIVIVCSIMSQLPFESQSDLDLLSLKLAVPTNRTSMQTAICCAARSTGMDQTGDYVKLFAKLWKDETGRCNSSSKERMTLFGVAVLRLVFASCGSLERELPEDRVLDICRLIQMCTDCHLLAPTSRDSQSSLSIVFEATRVLGVVGKILSPSTSKGILQDLAASFHRLLSSSSWSIRAFAMSSLVQFASTLPAVHKSVLLACLPKETQPLLQCRLQSLVFGKGENVGTVRSYCAKALSKACHVRSMNESMLPASGSFTIPPGSYFMTMPTQDGRQAIVVFPPDEQSLEDIDFMLGMDDENEKPKVQKLHKTVISQNGGCKLFLRS